MNLYMLYGIFTVILGTVHSVLQNLISPFSPTPQRIRAEN